MIESITKLFELLFPINSRKRIIDDLIESNERFKKEILEENEKHDKRIAYLEERYKQDGCIRPDCKFRVNSLQELATPTTKRKPRSKRKNSNNSTSKE